jgi:hypothetical protein
MNQMERVPYFFFANRENGVNRAASDEAGYEVPNVETFIYITPHGHHGDPMEFLADDFIARKKQESLSGRYDRNWVEEFKAGLALFRDGAEIPRHGTPIVTWERILKSRREQLKARFPTVEDLAATPDSSLGDIGMDGRVIRDMARGDIQAKTDLSPVVKQLADANEKNRLLEASIESLTKRLEALEYSKPRRPKQQQLETEE